MNQATPNNWTLQTIGLIRSPFPEKFGVPRQPGLHQLQSRIELLPPFNHQDAVRGLEQFSHLWVTFVFHLSAAQGWTPLIRPPRLGGNRKIGVFASRSPFRPNPIGLSAVKLDAIEQGPKGTLLIISGGDFVDGTPVLDIKPYIAYSDAHPQAHSGYAGAEPEKRLTVQLTTQAQQQLDALPRQHPLMRGDTTRQTALRALQDALGLDPRPAYAGASSRERTYYLKLFDLEIVWQVEGDQVTVQAITPTV
ncbi:MAG: tRNA (N6-threonylcarbamoyladenosine(37)-N6)-methyltransferase TrmO [Hahellaceae bacterium]|nr:tRNA (N6-threonylcarbamoyladenosine(37)-N6)-methyltransferase TrmO [Hahellaceae bacterium]